MRVPRRSIMGAFCLSVVIGCDGILGIGGGPDVDFTAEVNQPENIINVALRNRGSNTISVRQNFCGWFICLERREDGEWRQVNSNIPCACVGLPPEPIEPDAEISFDDVIRPTKDSMGFSDRLTPAGSRALEPGEYRYQANEEESGEVLVSNTFIIE